MKREMKRIRGEMNKSAWIDHSGRRGVFKPLTRWDCIFPHIFDVVLRLFVLSKSHGVTSVRNLKATQLKITVFDSVLLVSSTWHCKLTEICHVLTRNIKKLKIKLDFLIYSYIAIFKTIWCHSKFLVSRIIYCSRSHHFGGLFFNLRWFGIPCLTLKEVSESQDKDWGETE